MCGVFGIVSHTPVNQEIYDALIVLQHRGQDAAGIACWDNGTLHLIKNNGLVRNVFSTKGMISLKGNAGVGHVRYPTAGCSSSAEAQPFYVNSPYGISLTHNGNLTNDEQLRKDLFLEDLRHINTQSDSEILLNVFAHELARQGKLRLTEKEVFIAIRELHKRCRGAYASIAMINGYGIVGFRDPNGIRPLCYGSRETECGTDYAIASESVALDSLGFKLIGDVPPGAAVYVDFNNQIHVQQCADAPRYSCCIFEYVYLARPDSIIDDVSVYKARLRMGEKLAEKIRNVWPHHDIDVVIPIPDTSRSSALQLAYHLNVPFREGFIKNRYIGRTFIMPGQKTRRKSVRQKLNPIPLEFKRKNVLLVDDSIVRGTTSGQIIQMARDAGARKVYFASAAPPVIFPNVYGIDMPAADELVAHNRTVDEVCREIGADGLVFQDLTDLIEAVRKGNPRLREFDCSCFNGQYVTGDIEEEYLKKIEQKRNDFIMCQDELRRLRALDELEDV